LVPYARGELTPQPQPEEGVMLAPSLSKEDGKIDWAEPAAAIDRQVRAFTPWPGTFTQWQGQTLKVLRGTVLEGQMENAALGELCLCDDQLVVQTGEGLYRLDEIQPAGKRKMNGAAFLAGRPEAVGCLLGD
jgi:methionyl-tRNA formyltransferase